MSVSLKDTKNAIFDAYQKALEQTRKLEAQLKAKDKELSTKGHAPAPSTKVETIEKIVYQTASPDNIPGIVASLDALQNGIRKAISEIASGQSTEAEDLAELQQQIQAEKELIRSLYDIEAGNGNLSKILDEYISLQEQFAKDFEAKEKAYAEEEEAKQEAWDKAIEAYETEQTERETEAEMALARELEEYNYGLKIARKLEDDEYAQKKKALQEALDEIKAEKDKAWAEREKTVAERETEFKDYKTKFEGLDERLQKEIKKAEGEAKGIVERDHKVKLNLYKKEVDNRQKTAELRISALRETLDKQEAYMRKLNEQLLQAQSQAQNLAMKALEGTANAESFSAIREIALEQAKTSNKNK